jgi:hypothetical protein
LKGRKITELRRTMAEKEVKEFRVGNTKMVKLNELLP